MFGKMLGRVFGQTADEPPTMILGFLDEVRPGLARRAERYLQSGEDEDVLDEIPSLKQHKFQSEAARTQLQLFDGLLQNMGGRPEMLARLLRLRRAMDLLPGRHPRYLQEYPHLQRVRPDILACMLLPFFRHTTDNPTKPGDVVAAVKQLGGTETEILLCCFRTDRSRNYVATRILQNDSFVASAQALAAALDLLADKDRSFALQVLLTSPSVLTPGFLPYLFRQLEQGPAKLREAASSIILKHPADQVEPLAAGLLASSKSAVREAAVNLLGALGTTEAMDILAAHRPSEKAGALQTSIDLILQTTTSNSDAASGGYVDCHGDFIPVPEVTPLVDDGQSAVDDDKARALQELAAENYRTEQAKFEQRLAAWRNNQSGGPEPEFKETNSADGMIDALNGVDHGKRIFRRRPRYRWEDADPADALYEAIVTKMPLRRVILLDHRIGYHIPALGQRLMEARESGELSFAAEMEVHETEGLSTFLVTNMPDAPLRERFVEHELTRGSKVRTGTWHWVADRLDQLTEALPPHSTNFYRNRRAMNIIADFPTVPKALVAPLLYTAISGSPKLRAQAETLLEPVPGIDAMLIALLADKKQGTRAQAARFLGVRGAREALPALIKRLKSEKSEAARAEMIAAIERLGGDIAPYLSREVLEAEAQKLVTKLPDGKMRWLDLRAAPPLVWTDGTEASPVMLDAWARLALKLNTPAGSPLLTLYLSQMTEGSVRAVADWLLDAWIGYDTAGVSGSSRGQRHYMNSAADARGLLALTLMATPAKACMRIAAYLKGHGRRVPQAKALVETLSGAGTRDAVQVLVATATRFKQRTVRQLAETLVAELAETRNWSEDELADRSVPTGGFDADGSMTLLVGEAEKAYTAQLAEDLSITFQNPDGRAVKSLPAGTDAMTKEAKAQISAAKKAIKAAMTQQSERLYEAMLRPRSWALADWQADVLTHPLLLRMAVRLVWRGLDAEGRMLCTFRPTLEGDLYSAEGDDMELSDVDRIDLAHTANLPETERTAWLQHLSDFEVVPLFAQLSRPVRDLPEEMRNETRISDREGWCTTTYKLAPRAKKFGYERGAAGDGGGFDALSKTFRGAGITAHIGFTGSYMGAQDLPAAITSLYFTYTSQGTYARGVPLHKVPPMLLSEAWNDYHGVAETGTFDPDWTQKRYF